MGDFNSIEFFRSRTAYKLQGLIDRLAESNSEFPTSSASEVSNGLLELSQVLIEYVDKADDIAYLEYLSSSAHVLSNTLAFFDNAHSAQTPRSLALMLEDINSKILSDATVILWPQAEFNYSIRNYLPIIQMIGETFLNEEQKKTLLGRKKSAIQFISFPRILRDNILLHSILGHELGHPIADVILDEEEKTDAFNSRLQLINGDLEKIIAADQEIPIVALQRTQEALSLIRKFRRRALEEILSDVASVCLFGPSALFAMYEIFGTGNLDAPPSMPQAYPPNRLRIRVMRDTLNQLGMLEAIKEIARGLSSTVALAINGAISEIDSIADKISDQVAIERNGRLAQISYQWVVDGLPDLISKMKESLNSSSYQVASLKQDVADLIARIELGIPPNERGVFPNIQQIDWRSAIVAGWLVKLGSFSSSASEGGNAAADIVERMERLTLKAVEYVILKDQYMTESNKGFA